MLLHEIRDETELKWGSLTSRLSFVSGSNKDFASQEGTEKAKIQTVIWRPSEMLPRKTSEAGMASELGTRGMNWPHMESKAEEFYSNVKRLT